MSKAKEVYGVIIDHLDKHELKYVSGEEEMRIELIYVGDDLPQPTAIIVDEEREVVRIFSPLPGNIPEDKRIEAAVALAAANDGIVNGSFQLDLNDGQIVFTISQYFGGAGFDDGDIEYLLSLALVMTDMYNDKFFMLAKGIMSLDQFLDQIQ
jgi:hypothetical protein